MVSTFRCEKLRVQKHGFSPLSFKYNRCFLTPFLTTFTQTAKLDVNPIFFQTLNLLETVYKAIKITSGKAKSPTQFKNATSFFPSRLSVILSSHFSYAHGPGKRASAVSGTNFCLSSAGTKLKRRATLRFALLFLWTFIEILRTLWSNHTRHGRVVRE